MRLDAVGLHTYFLSKVLAIAMAFNKVSHVGLVQNPHSYNVRCPYRISNAYFANELPQWPSSCWPIISTVRY